MAVTLTRNLKLRIDSNLTANAKYNLNRIDLLGATSLTSSTGTVGIRSLANILIEPNSADLGGSGVGGTVSIGSAGAPITAFEVFAASFVVGPVLSLQDQATGATNKLALKYKSDLSGAFDNADRILAIDVGGADRSLILGGDVSTIGGNLVLALSGATSLTLPLTGTLSTRSGVETLTNKTIDGLLNTFTNLEAQVFPVQSGNSGKFLQTNGTVTSWVAVGGVSGVTTATGTWTTGTSFPFNHGLGTSDVVVSVIDNLNDIILVDTDITDANNITLTSSEAPTGSWRVVVHG